MRVWVPLILLVLGGILGCAPPNPGATKDAKKAASEPEKKPVAQDRESVLKVHPRGVAYVANSGDDTLSIFDLETFEALDKTVRTGHQPGNVALGPDRRLYFPAAYMTIDALSESTPEGAIEDGFRRMSLWAIDPSAGNMIVQKAYVGDPDDNLNPSYLSTSPRTPEGDRFWVAISDQGLNMVHFRDQSGEERKNNAKIETGPGPLGSAFSPDGDFFVVANNDPEGIADPDTVSVINFAGNNSGPVELARLAVGDRPTQVVAAPDNLTFYVTVTGSGKVVAIDASTVAVKGEWNLGGAPYGITRDAAGANYYVTLQDSNEVVQVSPADGSITRRVAVGKQPHSVVIDEIHGNLWVTNNGANSVSVVKVSDLTVVETVPTGTAPTGLTLFLNLTQIRPTPASNLTEATATPDGTLSVGTAISNVTSAESTTVIPDVAPDEEPGE